VIESRMKPFAALFISLLAILLLSGCLGQQQTKTSTPTTPATVTPAVSAQAESQSLEPELSALESVPDSEVTALENELTQLG